MKVEYVHFYVDDAKAWQKWFVRYLGFQVLASNLFPLAIPYACTKAVKSGSVCFLLSSPLSFDSPVAEFLRQHPPGVVDVAFAVEDIEAVISRVKAYGSKILQPVQKYQVEQRYFKSCKIAGWGSLTHTLLENFTLSIIPISPPSYVTAIDHIVLNVAAGDLHNAVSWYEYALGFQPQQRFNIQTERSALHSQVLVSSEGGVQLPINQPATPNSQIQEFLNFNNGPGIQHIALQTRNILTAIAQFRANGLQFLPAIPDYYQQLAQRVGLPLQPGDIKAIANLEILLDWNENTPLREEKKFPLLLQIFTQPIFGEPTFFFEFIERRNQATGFGEGNFRALFEAMENEQVKRGTLR